jgi:hypothetical protein
MEPVSTWGLKKKNSVEQRSLYLKRLGTLSYLTVPHLLYFTHKLHFFKAGRLAAARSDTSGVAFAKETNWIIIFPSVC